MQICPGDILVDLAQVSVERRYKSNQLIIRKGDEGTHPLRVILGGKIKQHQEDQVVAQLSKADLIGFHQVSLKDTYTHDYTTLEPCTCIEIPLNELFMFMGLQTPLVEAMIEYVQKEQRESKEMKELHVESTYNA